MSRYVGSGWGPDTKKYLKRIKITPIGAISCYNKNNERDSFLN